MPDAPAEPDDGPLISVDDEDIVFTVVVFDALLVCFFCAALTHHLMELAGLAYLLGVPLIQSVTIGWKSGLQSLALRTGGPLLGGVGGLIVVLVFDLTGEFAYSFIILVGALLGTVASVLYDWYRLWDRAG